MSIRKIMIGAAAGFALFAAGGQALAFTDNLGIVTQFDIAGSGPTVGVSNPSSGNCYPFSCFASQTPVGGNIYQQVYNASSFSGPLSINSVSFFKNDLIVNDGNMDTASYSVSFWTTPLGAGALVDSAAGNRGTELANFGTFSLGGAMPETLTLSGPAFNYNPTAGNLLMQVQVDSLTFAEPYQSFFQVDVTGASTSRFFDYGAAVPEPGAWALMLVGLGGLGAALRSRRKPAGAVAA